MSLQNIILRELFGSDEYFSYKYIAFVWNFGTCDQNRN